MPRGRLRPGRPEAEPAAAGGAEAYALNLLALRPRTVRELQSRLLSKGYGEDLVTDLVERCLRAGYLDDRAFARSWIEERTRSFPCGSVRLRRELREKGVPAEVTSEALNETLPPEREAELAVRLARKKAAPRGRKKPAGEEGDPGDLAGEHRARGRLWSFLGRRGFTAGACRAAMNAVFGPLEDLIDYDDVSEETEESPDQTRPG